MKVAPHSTEVRQIVLRTFAELLDEPVKPFTLAEMILVQDGKYRGRSYRAGGLMAMWLSEIGLVQIYDQDGNMVRSINLFEEQRTKQKAA
jgi:hypothetical protein